MTKKHPRRKQEEEEAALVEEEQFSDTPPSPGSPDDGLLEDDGSALPPHGWKAGGSDGDAYPPGTSQPVELDEHREKYLRLAAEYDNYRKRSIKEREGAESRGQRDLVRQLIEALDDLARFAHVDPAVTDPTTIVEGVQMVERKMMKTLSAAGLEIVNPVDEQFDPARHEAVSTEPAVAEEDDHTVARVYQPGYVFKGQLLRPARVVVRQWNG